MTEGVHDHEVEDENYFVSMTDMMVGLVFIFVILLMYFALQFRQTTDDLTSADRTRAEILEEMERTLKAQGIEVEIDPDNGVLRLPDKILFASGQWSLSPEGVSAVAKVAAAFAAILPRYACARGADGGAVCPGDAAHKIEAVFIEGHTDDLKWKGANDNWGLSSLRAIETFQALTATAPSLASLCGVKSSGVCEPILGVAGYAASRPVPGGVFRPDDPPERIELARARNRRIDIRILMQAPLDPSVQRPIEGALNARP